MSWIGARRFTSSARSISSGVKSSSRPLAGRPALATSTSTGSGPPGELRRRAPGSARSAGRHSAPSPSSALSSLELLDAAAAEQHAGAALGSSARAMAWPMPPLAPVRRTVDALELHGADAIRANSPEEATVVG